MIKTTTSTCQGCIRFELSGPGSFYQFVSEPGWEPARLIIDTDALAQLLKEKPRTSQQAPPTVPAFKDMVDGHEIFDEHVDHVNLKGPVFLGEYTFTETATGRTELFHLCPDGHHRIAKCLKHDLWVPLVMFTEEEMKSASYTSIKEYMQKKGVFVFGATNEDLEKVFWE